MNISALQSHVKAADLPIEKLAMIDSECFRIPRRLARRCRQFEAVFLRQILQEARKTVISSSSNHDSTISGIYGDMVNNQLADSISRSGAFGLAKSLQGQLVHQVLPHADTANPTPAQPVTQPHKLSKH